MTTVTIELDFDKDNVTEADVLNYLQELIDNDSINYEVQ
mgnify:CR=1 FL=1